MKYRIYTCTICRSAEEAIPESQVKSGQTREAHTPRYARVCSTAQTGPHTHRSVVRAWKEQYSSKKLNAPPEDFHRRLREFKCSRHCNLLWFVCIPWCSFCAPKGGINVGAVQWFIDPSELRFHTLRESKKNAITMFS